ncbi:MAG: glutathione S-transferase N-terminal domain-containing protein [Rhodoferax sp.]
MKTLIRLFFRALRRVLGPFMLLSERLRRQPPVQRTPEAQAQVAQACQQLVLYQFATCPFCIKVRLELHRLALPVALRDAQHDAQARAELRAGSGAEQVPCLRITQADGSVRWLSESSAIVAFLRQRFEPA